MRILKVREIFMFVVIDTNSDKALFYCAVCICELILFYPVRNGLYEYAYVEYSGTPL